MLTDQRLRVLHNHNMTLTLEDRYVGRAIADVCEILLPVTEARLHAQ